MCVCVLFYAAAAGVVQQLLQCRPIVVCDQHTYEMCTMIFTSVRLPLFLSLSLRLSTSLSVCLSVYAFGFCFRSLNFIWLSEHFMLIFFSFSSSHIDIVHLSINKHRPNDNAHILKASCKQENSIS